MAKYVCTSYTIIIDGKDVSDYVYSVETNHTVGNLVMCTVAFQGVRIEPDPDKPGQHKFHLVEREL